MLTVPLPPYSLFVTALAPLSLLGFLVKLFTLGGTLAGGIGTRSRELLAALFPLKSVPNLFPEGETLGAGEGLFTTLELAPE